MVKAIRKLDSFQSSFSPIKLKKSNSQPLSNSEVDKSETSDNNDSSLSDINQRSLLQKHSGLSEIEESENTVSDSVAKRTDSKSALALRSQKVSSESIQRRQKKTQRKSKIKKDNKNIPAIEIVPLIAQELMPEEISVDQHHEEEEKKTVKEFVENDEIEASVKHSEISIDTKSPNFPRTGSLTKNNESNPLSR